MEQALFIVNNPLFKTMIHAFIEHLLCRMHCYKIFSLIKEMEKQRLNFISISSMRGLKKCKHESKNAGILWKSDRFLSL